MSELHFALGQVLDGRTPYEDADYVEKGPYPFVCGTCASFSPEDGGMCELVSGPYDDGGVDPDDSCRFWAPRSNDQPNDEPEPGDEPDEEEE